MMMEIALTVVVCSTSLETASAADEHVEIESCEVFTEVRPLSDLRACMFLATREKLGRQALERAERRLGPGETIETTCRRVTGGGGTPAG